MGAEGRGWAGMGGAEAQQAGDDAGEGKGEKERKE